MRRIDNIFVHCTATPQTWTIEDLKEEFKRKGWKHAGYHIAITADGAQHQLEPFEQVANGVRGYNQNSIHVAYFGGMDGTDNRTEAQRVTIRNVLKTLKKMFPDAEIKGHRDVWGKNPCDWHNLCPGFDAEKEYGKI